MKTKKSKFKIKLGWISLLVVGISIGIVIAMGLVKGSSAISDTSTNWELKPVIVNIQVDFEEEIDQTTVHNILSEIEKRNGHATVFVTGEFASEYPEVIRDIEAREHQIAVHGWQKGEDLTLLDSRGQLELIQKAFSAVRNAVNKPEEVADFKSQGYKFNDDTIRILQEFGARSISGIFKSEDHQSFSACWYVQSLGEVTFPYPITDKFWAIPISTIEIDSKDTPLDDEYINNSQSFLNYLIEKYNQQSETKDPVIFVIHPSITGADTTKLNALSQFLNYVEQNGGKIKPLSSIAHQTTYITNFDVAPSTTTASVGGEITISGGYTSNIYCPHYRFRVYGKYKESTEGWEKLGSYCEFVYTGTHPLSWKIKIPPIPQISPAPDKYTYQIRVVGRASYGGCEESELWPTYDSYQAGAMKDIEIEVESLCIPYKINGSTTSRLDVVFVLDGDYGGDITNFKQHIDNLINNQYGATSPISDNMDKFNFYYTEKEGNAKNLSVPTNFWKDKSCKFADAVAILHKTNFADGTIGKVFSAEGSGTRSFIHESGHAIFDLADEYTETRVPPFCTNYSPASIYPNIWSTKETCEKDAEKEEWDKSRCNNFCPSTNPCCDSGWWRIDRIPNECSGLNDCDEVMIDNDNGFGVACARRINYVFGQLPTLIDIIYPCPWCPVYAEKLAENSVSLYLNINNDQLTLLQSEFSESSSPNYYSGDYPFRAEIISLTGELLGEYGFGDPRVIFAEIGYEGPTWIDNVNFPLILPYFHNAKTVNIYNSADELLLSVNIAQYDKGIMEGKVIDYNGNPILNAFLQIRGASEGSTYTNENGEYQLLVEPGYYEIGVAPDPYANLMPAFTSVSVGAGEIITQNFVLNPAGSIGGTVTDINGNPVPNVNVYLSGYEMPRYATNEEGKYIIPGLQAGTYTVNIDASGYGPWYILVNGNYISYARFYSTTVKVTLGQTTWVDFTQQPPPMPDIWVGPQSFEAKLPPGETTDKILTIGNDGSAGLEFNISEAKLYFYDNMESGENGWTYTGLWHLTEHRSQSPTHAWYYGREGYWNFDIGRNYGSLTSPPIDLTNAQNPVLTFWRWERTEGGSYWDYRHIYISTNNGATWNNIYVSEGLNQGEWIKESINLSGYAGNTVLIKFEFDTRDAILNNFEGWYIDDVIVSGGGTIDWLSEAPTSSRVNPGEQTEITVTIDATNLEVGEYKGYIIVNSNDLDESVIYIPVHLLVESARALKQNTLQDLEAAKTGDSSIDAEIDLIIQSIERSLTDNYWLDSSHLDSNYGRRVFSYQKEAVERMGKDLLRQDISEELKEVFRGVIKKLAKADEILAVIALEEAKDTPIQNPRYLSIVQRYLALAEEELAKAYQQLAQDEPEGALDSFRRSWEYSQRAISYANR